jgi:hypothetical protein
MQTDNHERLKVLRWLMGNEQTEALLQHRYVHLRLRGDWFEFCMTMLEDVGVPDEPIDLTDTSPFAENALRRFMFENKMPLKVFAEAVKEKVTTVHGWMSGHRRPGVVSLAKIEQVTQGAVRAVDFLRAEERGGVPLFNYQPDIAS